MNQDKIKEWAETMEEAESKIDEFAIKKELEEKRKNIGSFEELAEFLKDIKDNYNAGYGGAPRSIAQACLATGWFLSSEFGITGFQAGCVMWDFICGWSYTNNEVGLQIIDYDNLLYPQYDYKFENFTISNRQKDKLIEVAQSRLDTETMAAPAVINRWKELAAGVMPPYVTVSDRG